MGAKTTAADASPMEASPVAPATNAPPSALLKPAKKMATPPPQRKAAILVHQGSGSKRSTNCRKRMMMHRGTRQTIARKSPMKGPLAAR